MRTASEDDAAAAAKRLANVQARCALAGIALHALSDGTFLTARWNLSRGFESLDAVEQWLERVTGKVTA